MRWLTPLALGAVANACSPALAPDASSAAPARALLVPSLRRLSVAELSASASALVGADVDWSSVLPPDARQSDFSRSTTQSVDAWTLEQLDAAARGLTQTIDELALPPCSQRAEEVDEACREAMIRNLASVALRREVSQVELAELGEVFSAGAEEGGVPEGAALVVRALLGSAGHLYDTALGSGESEDGAVPLTDDELASQLAWLVSGRPPDPELARAARAGELRAGEARRSQALRLVVGAGARLLFRRFVEEWLGLNRVRGLAKSAAVGADFRALRAPLLRETHAVVDDAMALTGGSLAALFAGEYSLLPNEVAALYGVQPLGEAQRVSLSGVGRVGLLQHASFLATFAHEDSSAPVLRGKAVLERLLCRRFPNPAELGIDLTLPPMDPDATTRERFAAHARGECAGCHDALDGVGFTFENFDAVGRFRSIEAGKVVDTSGHVTVDGRLVTLHDSVDLARALTDSEELAACAARHVVRFAAGVEDPRVEDDFVASTRALPQTERTSLTGLFSAYVAGEWFARRAPR